MVMKKGFSFVEILIDLAILSAISAAVLMTYSASSKSMELAKAKIASIALANEKMEELRNMPYDDLATKTGAIYPPGNILDEEIIEEKGIRFKVETVIFFIDDPYDGCADTHVDGITDSVCLQNMPAGKPKDIYPYDYKKAEITVTKVGRNSYLSKLSSTFSAKAAETATNTGIIKLCIVDSTGAPVPEADISIENSQVSPIVDIHAKTGLDGCIMVPNLPPSTHNDYHLVVTKDGYSTDMTYPRTAQNPNALTPDVDVSVQGVTSQTLVIDKVSKLIIDVVDKVGLPISSAPLHIAGTKEMYFNPSTLKYVNDFTTDVNGHLELEKMEFDNYNFSVAGKYIVTSVPYQPINLGPNVTLNVRLVVSDLPSDLSIATCDPKAGKTSEHIYLTITGENFDSSVAVKIVYPGNNHEIAATNVSVKQGKEIEAEIDLTGAETGLWNLVITNPDASTITQPNGFEVKI